MLQERILHEYILRKYTYSSCKYYYVTSFLDRTSRWVLLQVRKETLEINNQALTTPIHKMQIRYIQLGDRIDSVRYLRRHSNERGSLLTTIPAQFNQPISKWRSIRLIISGFSSFKNLL